MGNIVKISVVIPMFNEEQNIPRLHQELNAILIGLGHEYEIIFVDDGSTDGSAPAVESLLARDNHVKIICFSRNFGHQAALMAGLEASCGQVVISMDADMQHPASMILKLVNKWEEGYQIVIAVREETDEITWHKRLASEWFYRLFSALAEVRITPNAADFRLLDRAVVDVLCGLHERVKFLRGLTCWVGFRVTEVPYKAAKRFSGTTKYSWKKMFALALDGITSFSSKPLYLSAYVGATVTCSGLLYAVYIFYVRFFTDNVVQGWTSITLLILIIGGLQLLSNGLLGVYLAKTYQEAKARPTYVVAKKLGFLPER